MNLEGKLSVHPYSSVEHRLHLILSCTGSLTFVLDTLKHFIYSVILLNFLNIRIFTAYLLRQVLLV